MNTAFDQLKQTFDEVLARFESGRAVQTLLSGELTLEQYKSALRQISHQARENPQIQAYTTARFRGHQRNAVRKFLQHAVSEIGHDQLALNDLAALGEDVSNIPAECPAPTTIALTAFAYYQSGHLNPVGYLGYLFFLEFMPTASGGRYATVLKNAGVPENAMSFLSEHTHVDVHHNRLMEQYVDALVQTEADIQSIVYAMRVTGDLYARMLHQAFFEPVSDGRWGFSEAEQGELNTYNPTYTRLRPMEDLSASS